MKSAVLLLALLALPSIASAQTSYTFRVYAVGASAPQQTYVLQGVGCNLDAPNATNNVNPTAIVWADPDVSGRFCVYNDIQSGPLRSRPIGNYEGTLAASNAAGSSAESNRVPFSLAPLVPAVPTGLRYTR